jgi:periplasmic protein TonB
MKIQLRKVKCFIAIFLFFWTGFLAGQTNITNFECESKFDSRINNTIYLLVDTMPEFPGGRDSLNQFIENNLTRRPITRDETEGTVWVSLIIESDGSLTNKIILESLNEKLDEDALKVIELMPKWKPGKCNGVPVSVKFTLPIKFRLN